MIVGIGMNAYLNGRLGDDSQNICLTLLHQKRRILRSVATSWTRDVMSNTMIRAGVKCYPYKKI